MKFVRKNELVISGTFQVDDNPTAQPVSASAVLVYLSLRGITTTTIVLTKDVHNVWSGSWDSSDAVEGRVDWMVFSSGGVVAATEGFFQIAANRANKV